MNRIIITLLLIASLPGCQQLQNKEQANVAVVQSMFDAFNRHDWPAMANHYADSALFLDPSFGKDYVIRSQHETAAKYAEMQMLFPDIRDDITGMYSTGDNVIVEFTSSGKSGDSLSFSLPISCVLTLKDGKIIRDATYYDL